jgi:hypothetical protein
VVAAALAMKYQYHIGVGTTECLAVREGVDARPIPAASIGSIPTRLPVYI